MKKIFGVIFLSVYLLCLYKPLSPYVNYIINFNQISTQLCENKNKPELECLGKCYLKKEVENISQSTDSDKPIEINFQNSIDEYVFYLNADEIIIQYIKGCSPNQEYSIQHGFGKDILDPPRNYC